MRKCLNARCTMSMAVAKLGTIAHECEYGSLHINDENMIVEILNNGLPCKDGEQGEIVVTELNNTAMPLIRYQLGGLRKNFSDALPVWKDIDGII